MRFEKEVQDFGVAVKGTVDYPKIPIHKPKQARAKSGGGSSPSTHEGSHEHPTVPPGKKGEIVITLDTAPLYRDFDHDIFVQFEPIQEMSEAEG